MHNVKVMRILPLLAMAVLLGSPAVAAPKPATNSDPLEPFNRAVFEFNQVFDQLLFRPLVTGYRFITPQVVRTHIGNVADNIFEPVNAINAFLQGDFTQGMQSFWRFVINSTIGLGGINDVASEAGLQQRSEDFGQTLAVWGVDSGPYLVLPILGPSNLRDTTGLVADIFTNPINYAVDRWTAIGIGAGQAFVLRERYNEAIDDINSSSLDPYATYRSIYQQRRAAQIVNKNVSDDDPFSIGTRP